MHSAVKFSSIISEEIIDIHRKYSLPQSKIGEDYKDLDQQYALFIKMLDNKWPTAKMKISVV